MPSDQDLMPVKSSGRRKTILTGMAVVAIMLLEGGAIYIAMKFFDPQDVDAAAIGGTKEHEDGRYQELGELEIANIKAPWVKTGRTFVFEMNVAIRVREDAREQIEQKVQQNKALISDRLTRVIRSAEPNHLEEDGLETVRRQIKHELGRILGDETMIGEVLIPRFIKFRADY